MPKSISQPQIENPVKCMKMLAVCRKVAYWYKITDLEYKGTTFEQIVLPELFGRYLGYSKKSHWMSVICVPQVIFDHRYLCSYYAQWLPDRKQHYTIAVHWVQKICKVAKFNIFVMPLKSVYNFHCAIVVWKNVRYC